MPEPEFKPEDWTTPRDHAANPGAPMPLSFEERERFRHHPPQNDDVVSRHEAARYVVVRAAENLMVLVPPGRERALVLTALQEAMMWANAGIALGYSS